MRRFSYLVTEGPQDVAFISRVLRTCFGLAQVRLLSQLDEPLQHWLSSYKWPTHASLEPDETELDIKRLSVPAPALHQDEARVVLVSNSGGLEKLKGHLATDLLRSRWHRQPEALGVVLDDDGDLAKRHAQTLDILKALGLATSVPPNGVGPVALAPELSELGTSRVGVFSLPGGGQSGMLEDVLIPLGQTAWPRLAAAAEEHVAQCAPIAAQGKEFKEFRSVAGQKKATLAAMTAILRPGKALAATIEDHAWVTAAQATHPALSPFVAFMSALLELEPLPG